MRDDPERDNQKLLTQGGESPAGGGKVEEIKVSKSGNGPGFGAKPSCVALLHKL